MDLPTVRLAQPNNEDAVVEGGAIFCEPLVGFDQDTALP